MARIRSIKPEVWTDPDVVSCSPLARLLFIGSWNHADDYGVLKDDPGRLKLQVLPADDVDAHALVDELVDRRLLVRRATSDGTRVLVIRTFCIHQKIDKRSTGRWGKPEEFTDPPEPPEPSDGPPVRERTQPIPTNPPESPEDATSPDHTTGGDRTGREERDATSTGPHLTLVADESPPSAADVSAQRFEGHFWLIWPRRHGKRVGKRKALAQWQKLGIDDQREAVRGAKHYAAFCEQTGTYPKDAERWLRDRLWEEWQEPAQTQPTPSTDPAQRHLEQFGAQSASMADLGLGFDENGVMRPLTEIEAMKAASAGTP